MKITVLGSGAALPDPNRMHASYLLTVEDRHYLIDCGQGATCRMIEANVDPASVPTVFLTHLHHDHCSELPYFIIASWMCNRVGAPKIFGPEGTAELVSHLFEGGAFRRDIAARSQYARRQENIEAVRPEVTEIGPGLIYQDDLVRVTAEIVDHIPSEICVCLGFRFEYRDKVVVFAGDTAPCEGLRHLARSRHFTGTLHLIFQPAEEGLGGASRMLADGLFDRFPCDAIFAMHNVPGHPVNRFGFRAGPFMASADTVTIRIIGHGGHGAAPHTAVDPVVVCSSIVMALQSIVSRNVDPQEAAVITVGSLHSGTVSNIIPQSAEMAVTVRSLSPSVRDRLELRIRELVEAQAASFGAIANIDYHHCHPVLINHEFETTFACGVVSKWLGEDAIIQNLPPVMASEDFAFLLEECPGAYINIGNGEASQPLHNPNYDFNDDALPFGASFWVRLTEEYLPAERGLPPEKWSSVK